VRHERDFAGQEARALQDGLTGLASSRLLLDRLAIGLARATHTDGPVTVLYLDLDGFKAINDRYGHIVGDMLLAGVAERLESCVRPADTIARLGGDEFGVVVESTDGRPPEELGHRLLASLDLPFRIGTDEVTVGASVGMAVGIWSGADQAVAAADAAMYRAKATGKGRVVVDVSLRGANA
jgi:diguanylate cyclase (GGDEF)-like protein